MIKLSTFLNFATITTSYLILTGCGFTRNIESPPPTIRKIYYQTERAYEPLEIKLKKKLKHRGIILLETPEKSSPIINIKSEYNYNTNHSISSIRARTYTLIYTVTINITDFHHKALLSPQIITATRIINLQPNEIFELTPQIKIIKQKMIEELILRIFNVLGSPETTKALKYESKS
ncbi:MAG: hypothetical protein LBL40_01465 [Coxiellaceae bacterium]|jgi:outer membrane lipopolysaccharide assembly protein LptE/RlpB|nr:hypothetical protein [Coxiellaceae bacterium]